MRVGTNRNYQRYWQSADAPAPTVLTDAEQWARLGNAVPPVMMQHIATAVRDRILRRADG